MDKNPDVYFSASFMRIPLSVADEIRNLIVSRISDGTFTYSEPMITTEVIPDDEL